MPTVTLTPLAPALRNSSAAAVVYGPTVDDPSAVIEPLSTLRLYVGFWVDAPTATDATARHAAAPVPIATPRRPSESFIVCPISSFDCPVRAHARHGGAAGGLPGRD